MINIKDFLQGVFLKVFPSLGYKGVVSAQISIYKRLKEENYKFLQEQLKIVPPAIGFETVVDEDGHLKKDITIEALEKFRGKNNPIMPGYSEENILNIILDSRRKSFNGNFEADIYFSKLIATPNKTLEQIICAIVEWEYLENDDSHRIRTEKNIPQDFVDRYRKEIRSYIHSKIKGA